MYRDILDRDEYRPIIISEDKTDFWILLIISTILIFVAWGICLILSVDSVIESNGSTLPGTEIECSPGQCATNIYSGQKRCPEQGGSIISIAPTEVCSSQYKCDNNQLPYSVQTDGSSILSTQCPDGINCRCVSTPMCANNVTSIFETVNGNPYTNLNGQRTMFSQTQGNILDNTSTQFCSVPYSWLTRSTTGCRNGDTVVECMNAPNSCNGYSYNPCISGTLAFISTDSDSFNSSDVDREPLSCIEGIPPPCGQIAIYDTKLGEIIYKTI